MARNVAIVRFPFVLLHRAVLSVLSAALLLPAGTALAADEGGPVEVTAIVEQADGGLRFVTSEAGSPAHGRDLARRLAARDDVSVAAVEQPVHAVGTADPLRDQQWGLTRLSAEQVWAGPATGQLVAVVDSGVDATHPDLAPVVVPGLDLVGDGDGRQDGNGHGTHVAGVVAAVAGNGLGGAGLAQGARVLPVRALDDTGAGSDADVAEGVVWAVDHGAGVVNLSLGGDSPSRLLDRAIGYALGKGVVVVAAAGNSGAAGDPVLYPAATAGVLAVGAVDRHDARPSWSSSGAHLSLAAPGVGIVSTVPGGGYESWSGTSMAAPFVAAAAALLRAGEPALSPVQLGDRLRATARDLGAPGRDPLYGAGLVDVLTARAAGVVAGPAASPMVTAPVASEPSTQPAVAPSAAPAAPTAPSAPAAPAVPSVPTAPSAPAAPAVPSVPEPVPPVAAPAPAPEPVVTSAPVVSAPVVSAPPPAAAPAPAVQPGTGTPPVAAPRADVPAPPSVSLGTSVLSVGQRVTVTYRGTPGAVVDVLSRTQPSTVFTRIATVVLDETGTATTSHAPQRTTRITARNASGVLSASAPLVAVRSAASMTLRRVATRTYVVTGRVYPARDGRLVSLYRDGRLVAQARCDANGLYVLRRTFAAGTPVLQVRTSDDGWNLGAAGPRRSLRVG